MKHLIHIGMLLALGSFAIACGTTSTGSTSQPQPAPAPKIAEPSKPEPADEIAQPVKAALKIAFPQATSFTEQHTKHHDGDLHTYIAFSNQSGKRATLGVGTVGEAKNGKYLVAVDNDVKIIKVVVVQSGGNTEVEAESFLGQFAGKTHDDAFKLGKDVQFNGKDRSAAEAVTAAIHHAEQDLQGLYGKPHAHSH